MIAISLWLCKHFTDKHDFLSVIDYLSACVNFFIWDQHYFHASKTTESTV